jgi:GT2 family glycosyltransferase
VVDDGYFNYARLNNRAAALSDAPYILFLNNDVELTSVSAVQDLKSWCSRSDVGLVGAELRYPNGALQHCGISFTREGPANMTSLGCYPQALREVSGVSFACAIVKREVFTTLGGLDEVSCPNGFGDALFSHRVQEMGLSILVNPAAKAVHHESATRGRMPEFVELFELAQAGVPLAEYWEEFHGSFQTTAIRYRLSGPLTQYLRWIPQFVNRALRRLLR